MLEDPRLPESHRNALDPFPADQRPFLADISLWEASLLVTKGRLVLDQDIESWLEIASSPSVVTLCPITSSVAAEMGRLPETFHQDPVDRLIVATQDRKIITSRLTRIWK